MPKVLKHPVVTGLLSLAILALILWLLRSHLGFLGPGFKTVLTAHPLITILATLCGVGALFATGMVMYYMLRAGGAEIERRQAIELALSSHAFASSFPGGAAFSAVLLFQVHRSWKVPFVLTSWFLVFSGVVSNMVMLFLGIIAIAFMGASFSIWSLIGTLLVLVGFYSVIYWLTNHPQVLTGLARKILPQINRILRRDRGRGVKKAIEDIQHLRDIKITPKRFTVIVSWSFVNKAADFLTLWFAIAAVTGFFPLFDGGEDQTTLTGVLLAYATGKFAGSIQATPGGVGPVETALTGVLIATGLTAVHATAAVILYRLILLVFVSIIGWVIYFLRFTPGKLNSRIIELKAEETIAEFTKERATNESLDHPNH